MATGLKTGDRIWVCPCGEVLGKAPPPDVGVINFPTCPNTANSGTAHLPGIHLWLEPEIKKLEVVATREEAVRVELRTEVAYCPTCGESVTDQMHTLWSFTCPNGHAWKRTDKDSPEPR